MSATNVAQMSTDEALLVLQFLQSASTSPAKRSYTVAVAIRSYIPHLICSLRPAIHVQSDLSVDESWFGFDLLENHPVLSMMCRGSCSDSPFS